MNTVIIPVSIQAKNIDALNRSVISQSAVQNGAVFQLNGISADSKQSEVFNYLAPAAGTGLANLWMAYSPEVVVTVSGDFQAKGIDQNPGDFTNIANVPFDAFKPQVGDLIQISAEGFTNAYSSATPYAVATAGSNQLTWVANPIAGLSFSYVNAQPIVIASGVIGGDAHTAYIVECVAID